jgi:hypothetical protein
MVTEVKLQSGEKVRLDEMAIAWGVFELPDGSGGLYQEDENSPWIEMDEATWRNFWLTPQPRTAN